MALVVVGLSHHTAPADLRDRVAVPLTQLPNVLQGLRPTLGKGVILSTCSRTEVYAFSPSPSGDAEALQRAMAFFHAFNVQEIGPHLYTYSQEQAVRHLFSVASGLDSLILGESQILGQVRDAYAAASRAGMAGGALSRLFHQALRAGKRARRETAIGRNALSVSRAAVELAHRALGDLAHKRVLVIGVGDAGAMAARALADAGATDITVANRTYARAEELAAELDGRAAHFADLPQLLEEADIAISATSAPGYVITPELVAQARVASAERPLFLIDIASPRDIDPEVKGFSNVQLYDIDDLEAVAETNRRARQAEAAKVEAMVNEETDVFMGWLKSLDAVPTIAALHQQAEAIRVKELAHALRCLPQLSSTDQATLDAFSQALVKKLLHKPTTILKAKGDPTLTQATRDVFGME